MRRQNQTSGRAFTIVEMIVIVGIIALLLGILLPALSGVQNRSQKMREMNDIRQVGQAWSMYANQNNDIAIPGYLDGDVINHWRGRYEYPVPHPATGSREIPTDPGNNIAGPWTWRLAPYLDHSFDTLWRYRSDLGNRDSASLVYDPADPEDSSQTRARNVAYQPAFGYNAFYVGGWWEMTDMPGDGEIPGTTIPRYRFWAAEDANQTGRRVDVVVRSTATIKRPAEFLLFCSATTFEPGIHGRVDNDRPGSHVVTPPYLAEDRQWQSLATAADGGGGQFGQTAVASPYSIEATANPTHAPTGRYSGHVTVLLADGSTITELPGDLDTFRETAQGLNVNARWINGMTDPTFRHTDDNP